MMMRFAYIVNEDTHRAAPPAMALSPRHSGA
jgi:hypothetical protein